MSDKQTSSHIQIYSSLCVVRLQITVVAPLQSLLNPVVGWPYQCKCDCDNCGLYNQLNRYVKRLEQSNTLSEITQKQHPFMLQPTTSREQ